MTIRPALWRGATLAFAATLASPCAQGIEYRLQFAPVGNAINLTVAGYAYSGSQVIGNCSYTQVTSGSGRDPRPGYIPHPQTCTWDLYGNLVKVVAGAPTVPPVLAVSGTKTIYARRSATDNTGADSAFHGGFVFTYGPHYKWLSSNGYLVLAQQPYTFTITLVSNGDAPLKVSAVSATTALANASLKVDSTNCIGGLPIAAAGTCNVTLTYDDTRLTSPTGLAYDTLTIHLATNSGVSADFVQRTTDEVRVPPDDGD